MPVLPVAFRPRRTFQTALLASVSVLTLFAVALPAEAKGILTVGGPGMPAVAAAQQAAMAAVSQAAAATAQARSSLARATQAIQAIQQAQSAARNLALGGPNNLGLDPNHPGQQLPNVPNGLVPGGLQVAQGVGTDSTLWQNANLPTQSNANGQPLITVKQTAQKSILTWQTFNVSKDTTVYFDQSAGSQSNGNNDWISLNRIQDPSGVPSQIMGTIKAEGSVYLINRNGIIFGGSSQVDVHTLIASSLGFLGENLAGLTPGSAAYDAVVNGSDGKSGTNGLFLNSVNGGIATPVITGAASQTVLGVGTQLTGAAASSFVPSGDITIAAGATISTHANGTGSDGGFVLIAAPNVSNAGAITTTDGQTILAAGIGVTFLPSATQFLIPELTGAINIASVDRTPAGGLTNSGLIQAETGNVTLLGSNVMLGGIVGVTTSVSRPGSITISTVDEGDVRDGEANSPTSSARQADRRAGQLVFSGLIADLPEEDGQSVPSDGGSFVAGNISLTGGSVWLQNGSLIEAPGASVGIAALSVSGAPAGDMAVQSRVYVDNGATIDVAGLSDVELPISDILVTIPLIGGNELADSPLLRNSVLKGLANVVIDSTLSGTTVDGRAWVGSPILDAAGYAALIPRTIDQLLTNGGSIALSGGQVMTATGSSLNLDGGYVHYLGGMVNTTRLVDASGHIVDIGNADPNDTYVGIAGQFIVNHAHWGITETYRSGLLSLGTYQPDYIQGGNAGTLSVFGAQAVVLDGALSAQAFPGLKQVEAGLAPSGTSPGGNFLPVGGSFILGAASAATFGPNDSPGGEDGAVIIQDYAPQLSDLAPGFNVATPLNNAALNALDPNDPANILANTVVPAVPLSTGGFSNVTVTEDKIGGRGLTVAEGTTLAVQPGGSITLTVASGQVSIFGDLIAPAGNISVNLSTQTGIPTNIVVGPDALVSAAGEWVNGIRADTVGPTAFINGGSIALSTTDWSGAGGPASGTDTSGSIILQAGSVLDVSSGGVMLYNGLLQLSNDIPVGKGGSVSLITYGTGALQFGDTGSGGPRLPDTQPTAGRIVMDGAIDSWGFAGGGTLTLRALGFQIGGDPTQAPAWDLYLPTTFFEKQGFGSYVLNALYDATVAPGATVPITQQNLIPDLPALMQAPSGSDLNQGGLTTIGTLDPYHRQATNLVMTAGGDLRWSNASGLQPQYAGVANAVTIGAGATIIADAGADIGLGSAMQVTVSGSIVAHGGSITLSADTVGSYGFDQAGQLTFPAGYTANSKSVWLGADALLDVSGVALIDPFAQPVRSGNRIAQPLTGKMLGGGSVVLSDDSGYVVAEAGSIIDVSGAAATFDLPLSNASGRFGGQSYGAQPAWSNAGTITLAAFGGLYFDGTINAQAGAPQGQGGTLTIQAEVGGGNISAQYPGGNATTRQPDGTSFTMPGATAVILQQSGDFVPAGAAPGQDFPGTPTGTLHFAVDRLQGSGIASLVIGGAATVGGDQQPLVPVAFAGNVNLSLGNAVIINTSQLVALAAGTTSLAAVTDGTGSIGAPVISISAPYVAIAGGSGGTDGTDLAPALSTPAALSDATLAVNAQFIDLENQLSLANFGQAGFVSSGDIRLSSTALVENSSAIVPGVLYTPGNLTFQAADLYPASGSTFIIDAKGPVPTTITFQSNGASNVPLSAGGTLLVDATDIVQSGTIRAPSGTIVLGVGNAGDPNTMAQFSLGTGNGGATLPLTDTQSVTLTSGSTTSVSLDGATVPYGTTIDGTEWQYNAQANLNSNLDLTAPPAKVITINGANVSLGSGAVIDLSGGGDLQAVEWVPGTDGSRDVLSQYNVTFPPSGSPVATPLYPDARNVYAIVPSYQAPVSAYDPVYAQSTQPNTAAQSRTASSGVGQAALGAGIGQSVYLSGVPGLPAGTYTLLPAKYATLPGAYRVVENTGASNVVPGQSVTMPDGTQLVSGYYVDGLNGAKSSTVSQFQVQSASVWQQYSAYTLTSANSFDFTEGGHQGTVAPPLPMDAGRLVLAATNSLILDTTLKATAAPGGAAAQVDIASQDIQIVGSGEAALAGYLQLSANGLDQLGAGSLLIGSTRTLTTTGTVIDVLANSVVVSNDAANPLTGPEIILVTKTDPTATDANAVNGLRIDSGSVIAAKGAFSASSDVPITIGGDGALLMVTNGGLVSVARTDLPVSPLGLLTVGAGATISGGQALVLDSSGSLKFDPTAGFSGTSIAVDASAITLTNETGAAASALPGFVIGQSGLVQFANATQVDLRSYSDIGFVGDVNLTFGNKVDLSAGAFTSDGGAITLNATEIAFTNDLGAPVGTAATGQGSLTVNANQIDLGAGDKALVGFGTVTMTASGGIVGQGTGTFDLGAANATLSAPAYLADTSSDATLTTTGVLNLNGNSGTPLPLSPVGGAISFIGGTLNDNGATIAAPAGNVSLEATSGDLTIASGSLVSSAGVSKQFFDITAYAPAGNITLTADTGSINVASGATLDFSGAQGGGAAGSLTLSAPGQVVNLGGTLKGGAAAGYLGGSFSLDTAGAVDLDNLAAELSASGVDDAITVQTGAGNLILSAGNTLTAHLVSLTADGGSGDLMDTSTGNVVIAGTINATGQAGGEIDLYGKNKVDIEGSLIATGSSATQRGGTVNIGTTATFDPTIADPYNAAYGYENLLTSGVITVGANALIDVSGGSAGGLSGGTVNFRAPLLANGDVNVSTAPTAQIRGSRATTLEAFAVWSTTDATTGTQHFDGIVDPAGWYDANGNLVSGAFTNQSGNTVLTYTAGSMTADQLATYLENDFFTPDNATTAHQAFYGYQSDGTTAGTLMGFVENFPIDSSVAGRFAVAPGIELDNPSSIINQGNISILTSWNLGAGSSPTSPDFRTLTSGTAPVITFRAENNVEVKASLTDGFFQITNPTGNGRSIQVAPYSSFQVEHAALYTPGTDAYTFGGYYLNYADFGLVSPIHAPAGNLSGTQEQIGEYYGLYSQYLAYLIQPTDSLQHPFGRLIAAMNLGPTRGIGPWLSRPIVSGQPMLASPYPTTDNPTAYLKYLGAYNDYLDKEIAFFNTTGQAPHLDWVLPPPAILDAQVLAPGTSVVVTPAATNNSPSPVPTADNAFPLLSSSLAAGNSSTFKIVAGADMPSANPLALQAAALFGNGGSVSLDGHFTYMDANNQTISAPTMIRTGTGSIDIAATNNISLLDTTAPGVIYTAGTSATGTPVGSNSGIIPGNIQSGGYDLLVTNAVSPDAAGDISIRAGNDITSVENLGNFGTALNLNSQFWWQWMQTGNISTSSQITQTSINFGAFDQGVMSVGGNISVSAGGNITNLAVSLPTTWYLTNAGTDNPTVNTIGGGNLTVVAGGNIFSGDYFVAKGTGTLTAGGLIGAGGLTMPDTFGVPVEVSTMLAAQDGIFNVSARQGVNLGGMVDPSYVQGNALRFGYGLHADAQGYSINSALNVTSSTGDVSFNTIQSLDLVGALVGTGDEAAVLPATVNLTAFTGGITIERGGLLYPSPIGQLGLIANQSINIYGQTNRSIFAGVSPYLGIIDASTSAMPSPVNPFASSADIFGDDPGSSALIDHSQTPLHAGDTQPVRIYSLTGSISGGVLEDSGFYDQVLQVSVDKSALIQAGQDIVNLAFQGQNLRESDLTRVLAGHDIWDHKNFLFDANFIAPAFVLGGPGTFDVEAGRNIGPLLTQADIYGIEGGAYRVGTITGIDAIGNATDPYLPHESANVQVLFGVGKGIDNADFIADYIAPGAAIPGIDTAPDLIAFMEQYDEGLGLDTGLAKDKAVVTLTADQAWVQFQALPVSVQQLFSEQILFKVLSTVGQDYNDPTSSFFKQYARGYQAINTLFPASSGYTANSLDGGNNGEATPVTTGDLDIRSTTIQTQQGGNVTILGPGGQALVGSSSAPPVITDPNGKVVVGPGAVGILTLEQGNVNIFTDRSLLLAQSRVFTEQGGDMVIWSSNGDINAGKGAKTIADVPPPLYVSDDDHYNTLDTRGEVTGAGIATLQTIPGAEPGSVFLIAPRGTVDAGDAGIRVSGDLFVAALTVANADNIQVQGTSTGVPQQASVNIGALTTASNASGAAAEAAQATRQSNRAAGQDLPSIITVEVIGYGGGDGTPTQQPQDDQRRRKGIQQSSYDMHSRFQVIGLGSVTEEQARQLADDRRSNTGR